MNTLQDDNRRHYVREKTRRIVGRMALKRASRIVQEWRAAERDDARLARRLGACLLAVALVAAVLFILN
jgi:hypothetical protein